MISSRKSCHLNKRAVFCQLTSSYLPLFHHLVRANRFLFINRLDDWKSSGEDLIPKGGAGTELILDRSLVKRF